MATPRWHALQDAFKEAWEKQRKDPANVHMHNDTLKELTREVFPVGCGKPISTVGNSATGRRVKVIEDDVPEGRYFFSD